MYKIIRSQKPSYIDYRFTKFSPLTDHFYRYKLVQLSEKFIIEYGSRAKYMASLLGFVPLWELEGTSVVEDTVTCCENMDYQSIMSSMQK